MKSLKLTLTIMIVANAVLMVMLLAGDLSVNRADAQVADRAGEYLGVTGHVSSTQAVLYLVSTRTDRMCVFFWDRSYNRLQFLANVDLKEAFATAVDDAGARRGR